MTSDAVAVLLLIGVIAFIAHIQIAIQTADMARSLKQLEKLFAEREELARFIEHDVLTR